MIAGIRIARFFGFEVRLDLSWFVVFFLVLWTFAQAVFPARVPGYDTAVYGAMAFAGAVLFFGSVLLHELAHSAMARARGITVEGITLFIFGGMARLKSDPENPKDEFLITVVGPLSSAAIGLALLAFAKAGARWGVPEPVTGVADFLAIVNFWLAAFNLIPGFPLDGGRLFRSLAWYITKDLRKATRWASYTGRGLGFVMIGGGIVQLLFQGDLVGGMWLIFIGWFLAQAAEASYRQLILRRILEGVQAHEAMTRTPETVPPELTRPHHFEPGEGRGARSLAHNSGSGSDDAGVRGSHGSTPGHVGRRPLQARGRRRRASHGRRERAPKRSHFARGRSAVAGQVSATALSAMGTVPCE
jgi:Zn-dependent protease